MSAAPAASIDASPSAAAPVLSPGASWWSRLGRIFAIAAIYFAAAKLGLTMAFVAEQVTSVWPPTGIALAAVLLFGPGIWPGIALGAFITNLTSHAPAAVAAGIALGNTLEALIGARLLHRLGFDPALARLRDVLALILTAGVSTTLSATIGVTSLCLGGVQPCTALPALWWLWWIGDAMGDLVMASLILVWATEPRVTWGRRRVAEASVLALVVIAVSVMSFARPSAAAPAASPLQHYAIFPVVIWAALRFGQRATVSMTFVAASVAVWSTVNGVGPFALTTVNDSLVALEMFMAVVATTALLLSAAIAERNQAERERAAHYADLRRQTEQLADADRRKDEFLAMLAHELRNPLAPLRNGLELLALPRQDPEASARTRGLMNRQLGHLVRLVDDLLDVSRITSGKIVLRREPLALADVVATALDLSRPQIEAHGHTLTAALPPEPVLLFADATRLPQVLANLLDNAAKYTDEGGHVSLTAERAGDRLVLRVRDSGIGMTPEVMAHAFDLFAQATRSLDRAQSGLGVGLTLVRRLVELHGGTVSAHSDGLGRGSEFTVHLPIEPGGVAAAAAASAGRAESVAAGTEPAGTPAAVRRVLVVDDNVDAAESLALLLQTDGHVVRIVHDGAAAVAAAREFDPEVVLLDIGLPGMDGYAVATALRADSSLSGVRLIAVSGYGQPEDRRRARDAGFDHHLVKPIEPAALTRLL
jgi:signal transduction histidine kinase